MCGYLFSLPFISVITTNWGGSTEFTTPIRPSELPVALLINTVGLVKTTGDNWLDGQWADIDEADLRNNLRELSSDRAFARDIGLRGRVHVLRHFNQQQVAFEYARRIKEIDNIVRQKRLSVRSDTVVDASLLRFLDEAAEPPMAVASDANTWSLSELPRGILLRNFHAYISMICILKSMQDHWWLQSQGQIMQ